MSYEEIQEAILAGPRQAVLAHFVGEIEAVKSLVEDVQRTQQSTLQKVAELAER